ncbi:MarR family transcriptional regulator [Streptomyces sp. NPDC050423]|uniref:MarR family winged helix-turn-helix transcriptional regulator n=1 Tax=Streptomyces sp. NPDC050423 TaxID=3155402 RepID=UPI00343676D2
MNTEKQADLGSGPVFGHGPLSHALFRVARLHKMLAGQLLRETGLYPGQELLMMRLWDDGPQRQIDLVRFLDSDAPTIARTVRRLEQAGYVRRLAGPTDGRVSIIEATPAGVPLRRTVEKIWAELESLTVGTMDDKGQAAALSHREAIETNLLNAEAAVMKDN